eukprot:CAMPEP_0204503120 /NCGR_PEP_ID=MMETSP0471-20130131/102739_1 /ASSEMBLY_ACC=CAM_ASM_000602 /TAXON_ID=2969 /ORGANISM="Oxyrrhis marina" /LENGTH=92 /DNA_ID=CAMNT_0051507913 /DNA_START=223 /DNA_END=501 /DNA_ORIENTATION=+
MVGRTEQEKHRWSLGKSSVSKDTLWKQPTTALQGPSAAVVISEHLLSPMLRCFWLYWASVRQAQDSSSKMVELAHDKVTPAGSRTFSSWARG